MTEIGTNLSWTFIEECSVSNDINDLLIGGEEAIAAYKTIRDTATFINKRLIIRDAQGITGKKSRNLFAALFLYYDVVYRKLREIA